MCIVSKSLHAEVVYDLKIGCHLAEARDMIEAHRIMKTGGGTTGTGLVFSPLLIILPVYHTHQVCNRPDQLTELPCRSVVRHLLVTRIAGQIETEVLYFCSLILVFPFPFVSFLLFCFLRTFVLFISSFHMLLLFVHFFAGFIPPFLVSFFVLSLHPFLHFTFFFSFILYSFLTSEGEGHVREVKRCFVGCGDDRLWSRIELMSVNTI